MCIIMYICMAGVVEIIKQMFYFLDNLVEIIILHQMYISDSWEWDYFTSKSGSKVQGRRSITWVVLGPSAAFRWQGLPCAMAWTSLREPPCGWSTCHKPTRRKSPGLRSGRRPLLDLCRHGETRSCTQIHRGLPREKYNYILIKTNLFVKWF